MDRKEMWGVARRALADHAGLLIRCLAFATMLSLVALLDVDSTVVFVLAAAAFGSELLPKTLISFPEREGRGRPGIDADAPVRPEPEPGEPADEEGPAEGVRRR